MTLEMIGFPLPYGFRCSSFSVGGSVAKANDAKVSMIKLTHSIWIGLSGESPTAMAEMAATATATTFTCFHEMYTQMAMA